MRPLTQQPAEAQHKLHTFLSAKIWQGQLPDIPELTPTLARKLVQRIDQAPLFSHAYVFHLNCRFGSFGPVDVLDFTRDQGLQGTKIHIEDGEASSLLNMSVQERRDFGALCREMGIELHVETSSTDAETLQSITDIARDTGATSIRCYPRYGGRLSDVMARTIDDLRKIVNFDPDGQFLYTLEQHEDMTSSELVSILQAVGNPRLSLMFDSGNSVNAYELPEDAVDGMGSHLTEVHLKDIKIVEERGGWAHIACRTGEGDMNLRYLLFKLLMLGRDTPQITAISLEDEVDYYAPAFRFPDEDADPFIPYRKPSETDIPGGEDIAARLEREKEDAISQVNYVRDILDEMKSLAEAIVKSG